MAEGKFFPLYCRDVTVEDFDIGEPTMNFFNNAPKENVDFLERTHFERSKEFNNVMRKVNQLILLESELIWLSPNMTPARMTVLTNLIKYAAEILLTNEVDDLINLTSALTAFVVSKHKEKALEITAAAARIVLAKRSANGKDDQPSLKKKKKRKSSDVPPLLPKNKEFPPADPNPPAPMDSEKDESSLPPETVVTPSNEVISDPIMDMDVSEESAEKPPPVMPASTETETNSSLQPDNSVSPDTPSDPPTEKVQAAPDTDATTQGTAKSSRPLPVFAKIDGDWLQFIKKLNAMLSAPASAATVNDVIKISAATAEDYSIILNFLSEGGFEHSTLTPREERPRKIAIRGIPHHVDPTDIKDALTELGYNILSVRNITNRATKVPFNLFAAQILPTPDWTNVYKLKDLLHLKVNIRRFTIKTNRPPQCHRCQRYSHSSWTCAFTPRCVKCGEAHNSADCTLPRESAPKCCLCKGQHTANFSGCPAAPSFAKKSKKPAPAQQSSAKPNSDPVPVPPAPRTPKNDALPLTSDTTSAPSYAQVVRKPKKKPRSAPSKEVPKEMPTSAQVEEAEVTVQAPESQRTDDLPSATKELMREFCSCVSEVRAWFNECSFNDIVGSLRMLKSWLDSFNFLTFASVWKELENSFRSPSAPDVQLANLLNALSKNLTSGSA